MEKAKRKQEIVIKGNKRGMVFISKSIYNESQKILGGKKNDK